VAQDCIRYLRDQRVGTCTFLPLDNLVAQPLPERLRSFGSRYKPCVDLLESAEQYKVRTRTVQYCTVQCNCTHQVSWWN
jgi:structural maintenance of chromosome 1